MQALGVLGAVQLAGCAYEEAQTARALLSLPPDVPRTTGIETPSENEHKRLVSVFGGEYHAQNAEMHLNHILFNLAQAGHGTTQAYRVTILNTPVINAFARPSGDIYVTRGLLALANDLAEIAAVMAHEIAHVTQHHAAQRDEIEKNNAVIARVADAFQGRAQKARAQTHGLAHFAQFSRQQEFDADEYGVETMVRAGYEPMGAVRILKLLARYSFLRDSLIGQQSQSRSDMFSTHPSTPERIVHAQRLAQHYAAMPALRSDRQAYLDAINWLAYGDNPDDGVIRGRRFIHPRLGFSFTAPDDFALENSSQAVVGIAHAGSQALRLDHIKLNADQSLDGYLASGWVDGLIPNSIALTQINGLPAALAGAQTGLWSFQIVVIRLGTDFYRLIYAAQNMNDDVKKQFANSISSFRRVSTEEASRIHPLFISEVTAQEDMRAETMAGLMALTDRPLEHFLLMNGLDKGGQLQTGQIYKSIRE